MPLLSTCKESLGRELFVLPYFGHGWGRQDIGAPQPTQLDILGPEPFHLRIEEFINDGNQLMGISGTIREPEHAFDGHWCCCLLRNTDDSDFTTHVGKYLIWIAKERLTIKSAPLGEKALFEWVVPDKTRFCLCGYGTIAESADWLRDIYERTSNSRMRVKRGEEASNGGTAD